MQQTPLDAAIQAYDSPLQGGNLPASTLPELVNSSGIVILHFLRHLGCLYCKAQVDKLFKLSQQPGFPPIVFVHQSDAQSGQAFFEKHFPGAAHLADPKQDMYKMFGIRKLGGLQLFNPRMLIKGIALSLRGYRNRIGQGNVFMLSGTFLFFKGKLRWNHLAKYAGDDPNWDFLTAKKEQPSSAESA